MQTRYASPMVAKKNRRQDLQQVLSLHLEACKERDDLLAQARQLKAAGKIKEARVLLKTAEFVEAHVAALEDECRRAGA
jgi:hypothetical protein